MPSSSKSVRRYSLVNFRSLVPVHLFGGRPICLFFFCICWLLLSSLSPPWLGLTDVPDVHWVLADRNDSGRLKIDGFGMEWDPIDELIIASGFVRVCHLIELTLDVLQVSLYNGIGSYYSHRLHCTRGLMSVLEKTDECWMLRAEHATAWRADQPCRCKKSGNFPNKGSKRLQPGTNNLFLFCPEPCLKQTNSPRGSGYIIESFICHKFAL